MRTWISISRSIALLLLLGAMPVEMLSAADAAASGFGEIAIPKPPKPAAAERCVEPVAVMRRDHMKFLTHQRDATVIDGERNTKYSLVGCIDCHNPASASGEVIRYENPQHFCAECHAYASVKIDCFECHADRGLERQRQSKSDAAAWDTAGAGLSVTTLRRRLEAAE